jgi:hypothetical protein
MAAKNGQVVAFVENSGDDPVPAVAFNVHSNGTASVWSNVGIREDIAYREPSDYDATGGGKTYHLYK